MATGDSFCKGFASCIKPQTVKWNGNGSPQPTAIYLWRSCHHTYFPSTGHSPQKKEKNKKKRKIYIRLGFSIFVPWQLLLLQISGSALCGLGYTTSTIDYFVILSAVALPQEHCGAQVLNPCQRSWTMRASRHAWHHVFHGFVKTQQSKLITKSQQYSLRLGDTIW